MEMSLMSLEVDGSLRNPAVAWAVGLWSSALVIIAIVAARRYRDNRRTRLSTLLALLAIASPFFVKLITSLFYMLPIGSLVAVHFWGMTRYQWLAPAISVAVFLVIASRPRRHVAAV
jgi:hypothetical protein